MALTTKVDNNLEALRGYCAAMVLLYHCLIFSEKLDKGYNFNSSIISFMPNGPTMVMVFFMLSGYVIGLTSGKGQSFNIGSYLKRRLVRLYPIYLFAILVTAVLFKETMASIIGTLLFGQNLLVDLPNHDRALWSINYEVVFYILAIPVLKFNINPKYIFGLLFFLLAVALKMQYAAIIPAYIIGFIFWITGYTLSQVKMKESIVTEDISCKLMSLFFLLLTDGYLKGIPFFWAQIIKKLNITTVPPKHLTVGVVNITDLGIYFICVYAICTAASIKLNWVKPLTLLVFLSAWGSLLYVVYNGSFFKTTLFYIPAVCLILSTTFYFIKKAVVYPISFWTKLGGISYALYVIHEPIMFGIGQISFFSGSSLSFITRLVIVVAIATVVAYLLEKKLQPRIKKYFFIKSVH